MRSIFEEKPENFVRFRRAVLFALKNGWDITSLFADFKDHYKDFDFDDAKLVIKADDGTEWEFTWREVIFRIDFVKAIFGSELGHFELMNPQGPTHMSGSCFTWQYFIMRMVVNDDPLSIIDTFLNDKKDSSF